MDNEPPARNLVIVAVILGLAIIIALGAVVMTQPEPVAVVVNPPLPTATPAPTATPVPIQVYVSGAVNTPQITVSLPVEARVQDAIDAAGGLAPGADLDRVNLAGILRDGDQVHVFLMNEPVVEVGGPDVVPETSPEPVIEVELPTPSGGGLIFVNSATLEELDTLPGIGPAIAQRIIDYREANGPFADLQSMTNVSGIGEATIGNIAELVSFE